MMPFLDGLILTLLSFTMPWILEDFMEDALCNAINDFDNEKASRLDGFNMAFFSHCWNIVKGKAT